MPTLKQSNQRTVINFNKTLTFPTCMGGKFVLSLYGNQIRNIMKPVKHPILKALHKIEKMLNSDEVHPVQKIFLEVQKTELLVICN